MYLCVRMRECVRVCLCIRAYVRVCVCACVSACVHVFFMHVCAFQDKHFYISAKLHQQCLVSNTLDIVFVGQVIQRSRTKTSRTNTPGA